MTEETRESYDSDEVVWVKLGSSWWPGEVKNTEELPSDVQDFKKPPLVIVKFFDEDSYEYVKSWASIYPYDCEKKNEFIKKGMAAYRAKVPHMEKFPKDVLKAEEKLGGNPNILSNPMFLPEKKRNYAAEIFGTPSPKTATPKNKRRSNKSGGEKDTSHITHRRFLGVDDYRAYILIQYPGKDRIPGDREDDEVIRINRESEQAFNCHSCSFSTKRLEVMILHTKSHIQGVYKSTARRGKQSAPRRRKDKSKRDSDSSSSDSEPAAQKKRKPKSQGGKKAKAKKAEAEEKKVQDIRSELLEAWTESDDEELDVSPGNLNSTSVADDSTKTVVPEAKSPSQTIEEALNDVSGEPDDSSSQSELAQPAEQQLSTEKLLSTLQDDSTDADDEVRDIEERDEANKKTEEQKMNPDVQEAIKSCFDFDEDEEEDSAIVREAAGGRKIPRVIPMPARKDSTEEKEPDMDAAFEELMEVTAVPDLPDVRNTLKCEQNFHNIKTIKFPDKPEESPPRPATEVATKLTNPKKRFVKSFEDFELMQNEIRRKEEEEQRPEPKPDPDPDPFDYLEDRDSPDSSIELSKLKSKIMSKIIEEANINPESKHRIMSKIQDGRHKTAESELKVSTGHRTPRSKILESYRKDSDTPPKIIWSRRGSHPKKDKGLVLPPEAAPEQNLEDDPKVKGDPPVKETPQKEEETAPPQVVENSPETVAEDVEKSPKSNQDRPHTEEEPQTEEAVQEQVPAEEEVIRNEPEADITEESNSIPAVTVEEVTTKEPEPEKTEQPSIILAVSDEEVTGKEPEAQKTEEPNSVPVVSDEEVTGKEPEAQKTEEPSTVPAVLDEEVSRKEPEAQITEEPSIVPVVAEEVTSNELEAQKTEEPSIVPDIAEEIPKEEPETQKTEETCSVPTVTEEEVTRKEPEAQINDVPSSVPTITEEVTRKEPEAQINDEPSGVPTVTEEVTRNEPEAEKTEEPSDVPASCAKEELIVEEAASEVPSDVDVGADPRPEEEEVAVTQDPVVEDKAPTPIEVQEETVGSPKSRKRKLSETETVDSPVTNVGDLQSDSATSPKKRLSEAETSPQFFRDFLAAENDVAVESKDLPEDKMESEIEIDPVKDLPEDKEIKSESDSTPVRDEIAVEVPMEVDQKTEVEEIEKIETELDSEVKKAEEEEEKKPEPNELVQKDAIEAECSKEPDAAAQEHNNEVEIHCAGSSADSFKFSIQTNLSILSSREEMSALALATLSEMKADLEGNEDAAPKEEEEKKPLPPFQPEPELVPIEGNLTVVSEKDLADGQVEITSDQVISQKRPATLSSFSLDFSDSFSDSNSASEPSKEFNSKGTEFTAKALTRQMKKLDHKKESTYGRLELINILEGNSDADKKPKPTNASDDICDFEEHIPSQIVCAKALKKDSCVEPEPGPKDQKKTSKTSVKSTASKLLERLTTESKAKAEEQTTPVKPTRYVVKPKAGPVTNKPITLSEKAVPEPKSKPKKQMEDIEDVEAFVIHKDPSKLNLEDEDSKNKSKTAGKAKILQQTIITPAGEIIQPETQPDDNIFDINSMPIVLSDEIFTPESIEKMPIVIGSDAKPVKRPAPQNRIVLAAPPEPKTVAFTKHKPPRILQTAKNSPLLPSTAKAGKYIIVPQSSIPPAKYTPPKKPALLKKAPAAKVASIAPEPSGNKIMIVTNQQGQQQRLLLTPAQQKMLGYQNQKVTKTIVKGNVMQKGVFAEASTSGVVAKPPSLIGQKVLVSAGTPGRIAKTVTKRVVGAQKPASTGKLQKTILIKDQHGQTVRRIQGTDDELLDKQVAEQLKAIKASSGMKFSLKTGEAAPKTSVRRSYSKRVEVKPRGPPPLAIQQTSSKQETPKVSISKKLELLESKSEEAKTHQPDRPLNQLVIQDAVGNQTTITEGQILALPSETVDGQPQSYMLVTLDESGNLTPLNSEALMSLDPNLGLGGDLSNMVLQIDQSAGPQTAVIKQPSPAKAVEVEPVPQEEQKPATAEAPPSTNGDPGQQLIVTGDPIATQKFLESLTEGTTDLANILANADGNSILIQADGQQILINTNTDNQMLLSTESTEGGGNPIFATQPSKNQDILAAALADTDVFPPSKTGPQLSPSNALYPMNVSGVLETSLTLSSPIMSPLEVPSTNSKKVADDDILKQVPKNVDLPITITDPSIAQTVANQHLELEMNSLSYGLPALDVTQKPFNGSMPLLTEDAEAKPGKPEGFQSEEGRFTLGGEMCSSLSEPPPEMFELPKDEADTSSEGSCEIPVQPQIVAESRSLKRSLDEAEGDNKKCKFD